MPPPELQPPKKASHLAVITWFTDATPNSWHKIYFRANGAYLMVEERDCACAQEACSSDFWMEVRGWGAPLGGLSSPCSSSEELSSDAPRMNLRRSLASGPGLGFGVCVLEDLTAEGTCRASASMVLTSRSRDTVPIWGVGPSFCCEVEGTVDRQRSPGGGDCAVDESSLAEGGPSDFLSSFTGIINGLVLILQNKYSIHRINPIGAKWSIHGPSPEAATIEQNNNSHPKSVQKLFKVMSLKTDCKKPFR